MIAITLFIAVVGTFLLGMVWSTKNNLNYLFKASLIILSVACAFSMFSEISALHKMPDKTSNAYMPLLISTGFLGVTWKTGDRTNLIIKTLFVVVCVVLIYGLF
jgi:hypothetical protein